MNYCVAEGLWIIGDPAYGALSGSHRTLLSFTIACDNVVEVFSQSKDFNACGMRIAESASFREDLNEALLRQAQAELAENTWAQVVMAKALMEP